MDFDFEVGHLVYTGGAIGGIGDIGNASWKVHLGRHLHLHLRYRLLLLLQCRFHLQSTSTSILPKLATRIISVPVICMVPTTRSPSSALSLEMVPSAGE